MAQQSHRFTPCSKLLEFYDFTPLELLMYIKKFRISIYGIPPEERTSVYDSDDWTYAAELLMKGQFSSKDLEWFMSLVDRELIKRILALEIYFEIHTKDGLQKEFDKRRKNFISRYMEDSPSVHTHELIPSSTGDQSKDVGILTQKIEELKEEVSRLESINSKLQQEYQNSVNQLKHSEAEKRKLLKLIDGTPTIIRYFLKQRLAGKSDIAIVKTLYNEGNSPNLSQSQCGIFLYNGRKLRPALNTLQKEFAKHIIPADSPK